MDGDRGELAVVLRRWRERVAPGSVGLSEGPARRRTPGLRREELARLADVSVDYVTRLEQGRGSRPSTAVLAALARGLGLSDAETGHLFTLAGVEPPGPDRIRDAVRPSVSRLLERMRDLPAMLVNARGDILVWNEPAGALLGDLSAVPAGRRTHLWLHFVADEHFTSRLVTDDGSGPHHDRSTVAGAHAALARYPHDARLRATVEELRARVPRFAALWEERPIERRRSDVKSYDVPGLGRLTLDCEALEIPDDDQTLIVYSASPGSEDARKLDLLRATGTRSMGPENRRDDDECAGHDPLRA